MSKSKIMQNQVSLFAKLKQKFDTARPGQLQKRFDKLSQTNEGQRRKVFIKMKSGVNKAIANLA